MTPLARSKTGPAVVLLSVVLASASAATATAQQASAPAAGREAGRGRSFEIAIGGEVLTSQSLGTSTATLTPNQGTTPFTYFVVDGSRGTSAAFRGRLGYNLTRVFTVEGGVVIARGNVNGTVSSDSESATAPTLTERMTQYFIDVSILAHLRRAAFASGAGVPFVEAGGGYLRQVHEGNLAIDTGQIYHFGGGVTYMFSRRPQSRLTGLGFRADVRVYVPRRSYSFDGSQSVFAGVGGSLVMAF